MTGGFEVGTAIDLRASHTMPGVEGPEALPHQHDYRIEVRVGRVQLDHRGMVCDLDLMTAALGAAVERLQGTDLDAIRPQWAEVVTVEVLARWVHNLLAEDLRAEGAEWLAVRVWESDRDLGGYRATL
jgi:6-pyruvoyl-tetrahydropterin synthase